MDLDDLDIYDDLETFQQVEEKKSAELLSLESKYNSCLKTIEELQKESVDLKKQIKRLNTNFQNLLNTAKAEINRKDKQIERLHKEKDDICFRRNQRWMESGDLASTNINNRNQHEDARILTQNCKTQFNHKVENDTIKEPCIAESKISNITTKNTLDAYSNARIREESHKYVRRDEIPERRYESGSNHEKDVGRHHMQRDQHKLMRYTAHSREREESGRSTTRDNSHSSRAREHVHMEKRHSRNKRSHSDSKEKDAYSNKSEYCGRRQHSYDAKDNMLRHDSEDKSRSAHTEKSRERHSESKRCHEDSKKPTTHVDAKDHKKLNNSDKNTTDKLVKVSDDIDHRQYNLVKPTKTIESKCENAKEVSIKKVGENGTDSQELNKTSIPNKNTILCKDLCATQNSYNIEEEPETREKSSCRMITDGKSAPQMEVLFERLFGSTPNREQSVKTSQLSNVKLKNSSSSSTTTSPDNYTDTSEQIAPTSKSSLPKSETDEFFVPIKGSERKLSKDGEGLIILSDSNDGRLPGLCHTSKKSDLFSEQKPEKCSISDRSRETQISEGNSDATTTMTADNANNLGQTVKPLEVSTLVAQTDDEIQKEFTNVGERNDMTDVKYRNESTFKGLTNEALTAAGGRTEILQSTRQPNIYEIRALQRRLKAEAAKSVKTSKLSLTSSEMSIKETASNTIAARFTNSVENCEDAESQNQGVKSDSPLDKTKNSLSNPLEESVVMDSGVTANDQKKELIITNNHATEEKSVDFEKKKQNINSESEIVVENPPIAESTTSDSIKTEQEISAENLAIANRKETNVVEMESDCQRPANKSIVLNKTEAEANELHKVKPNRQSKSQIWIIKAKDTILERYDIGEFHMKSTSKGKKSALPANNKKSGIQANLLSKSCVAEEKMSAKCPAVPSTNPTECHKGVKLIKAVKEIASSIEISDQSKNNKLSQSNISCENGSFSREETATITRSTVLEVTHDMEENALAPCEDAIKMKGDSESVVGIPEKSNEQKIADDQNIGQAQKFVDKLKIPDEQKIADEQRIADKQENVNEEKISDEKRIADEQEDVNKQKIADEQKKVERQKIIDKQEIPHEKKILYDREIADEQKVEQIGGEVQKVADGEVEKAKHKPAESPNECHVLIENENINAKSSEIIAAESSKLNRNSTEESNKTIAQLVSADDNSKTIKTELSVINVNGNSMNTSTIAKSDSDVQADNKQKGVDEKNAVVKGGNSQIGDNRTKSSDIASESESKELQDELTYLISSKDKGEVRYLDEIQVNAYPQSEKLSKEPEPKAGEEHLKKIKCSAVDETDRQNSEAQTRELVKSRELSLEHNALLYNMKRAEIMVKFKIPKISAKRKRENSDESNKANASLKNEAVSEDGVTKNPKTNDSVEEGMGGNKKKPKKDENSTIAQKIISKKEETKVVEINANVERELIDKRLPNGRTPEEEQALSAEQMKSERIIREIDNWARRKVGAALEITENAIITESGKLQDSERAELITAKGKSKLVTASITQEGKQTTEINPTLPAVLKSSKMAIEKSLTLPILPPQRSEQRERGEKGQLANIATVNGDDLENVPSHLPNKRCKRDSSADIKASETHNNQKTDQHKPLADSKSHQTPTNNSETNCKGITKHATGTQQHRKSEANEFSICSEERSAKDGQTHDGMDQSAVADGEDIAPGVSVRDALKMVDINEQKQNSKGMINESQAPKLEKCESQASEQLECKSKIQHSTEKVSSTSRADVDQVTTNIPNNNSKCSFVEKLTENHDSPKEKSRNTAVGKKREIDEERSYAVKETVATDSQEKCAKTEENRQKIEKVQKPSSKEISISSKREKAESFPNHTNIDRSNTVEKGVDPRFEYKHSKIPKRHRSDVRTNDECEVISKPRKRKRCQLRIEDSEEEDACSTECATAAVPTPKLPEVSAMDSQEIDILDILQNDRSNATLPAPETPSSLPVNISQDEQYKEIDSRLEQMFASPKVTDKTASAPQVRTFPEPSADVEKLRGFQPVSPHSDEKSALESSGSMSGMPGTEKAPSTSAARTIDFNVSDSDISSNSLQVSGINVTIDETNNSTMSMNSTLSDSNLSTKRISLGSSDYRFEKISDNVVNLFITRKRRGKRKQTTEAVTTTTAAATTIPTNIVSKT